MSLQLPPSIPPSEEPTPVDDEGNGGLVDDDIIDVRVSYNTLQLVILYIIIPTMLK